MTTEQAVTAATTTAAAPADTSTASTTATTDSTPSSTGSAPTTTSTTTTTTDTSAAPADTTVLQADGATGTSTTTVSTWPENWREEMAGDDAKELERLKRFASPNDVYKFARETENKLRSGKVKTTLAEDATPEQIAEYRKENGIPEKPEDYKLSLPEGLIIGDEDQPYVDKILADAHAANADPNTVSKLISSYMEMREQDVVARANLDKDYYAENNEALKKEWGNKYQEHINNIMTFLEGGGESIKEAVLTARDANGNLLRNNAELMRFLNAKQLELNPTGTIVSGSARDTLSSINDELAVLAEKMKDREVWFKDEKSQARQRQLLEAQEKFQARAGKA